MDTKEVIIENIISDKGSNDKSCEEMLNPEKNDSTQHISETLSSSQQTNLQTSEINETINDCKVVLIHKDNENKWSFKEESNIDKQQTLIEPLYTSRSKEHIQNKNHSSSEDPNTNKHVSTEESKQKDSDVSIVYESNSILPAKTSDVVSSLVSIAVEYNNSDSEVEDISNVTTQKDNKTVSLKETQMQNYRQTTDMVLSESSEDEDDSSSSSSSSSSSVSVASDESDSDDNTNKKNGKNNAKGQKNNEMKSELDDLPPIEDLKISVPEVLCDPLGEVAWMVEPLVVVKPKPGKPTLNLDTVLFVSKGQRALGKIFDVFGQVGEPHYCVRFNSTEHIQQCDIKVGMTVYYCPNTEYTSLVFLHEIMKIKGIDATADEPPEFSDDEEERAYYEKLKAKQTSNSNETDVPLKRKRTTNPATGWQSNHPWNRNAHKNRKGYYSRGERNQFSFTQTGNQSQNLWPHSYQNWPQNLHLESNEQYGYGTSSLQSMQYANSINQNLYTPHNYYSEDNAAVPLNPRIPFNLPPRIPSGYMSFQNRPNLTPNVRFQNSNMPWQSQVQQIPMRMRMPWVPLPPPPPPPTTTPSDMN